MGIISLKDSSCLYWLGRYAERAYTTLDSFFDYYDSTLDKDKNSYRDFLKRLDIDDTFGDYSHFLQVFLYGKETFSISSMFRFTYDNALVLKSMIGSESLAYLELASNVFHSHKETKNLRLAFMPVMDYLLAYWGCIDDHLAFGEAATITKCGKIVERLDLYFRFDYDTNLINREFDKLCHLVARVSRSNKDFCDTKQLAELVDVLAIENSYKDRLDETLTSLNKLFEELAS